MTPGNPMDAPFDRGEVDRASLEATERLRARLSSRPAPPPSRPNRSFLPWVIAGGLFVFIAGMIANPWFEARIRNKLPFASAAVVKPAESAELATLRERMARLENPSAPPPTERLARSEAKIETSSDQIARDAERIDRLTADLAALAASHQADHARAEATTVSAIATAERAQAMLTLVLVRRAVDAGRPLGALDGALRSVFEPRYPDAVRAVAALGTAPVTLTSLRRDFNALRPAIGVRPITAQRQSWWDALTTTITAVVSPSSTGTPQAAPDAAAAALARGDYNAAAVYLRRLPAPPPALVQWLAAVDRLQRGSLALTALETASLLAPPIPSGIAAPVTTAPPSAASDAPAPVGRASAHIDSIVRSEGGGIGAALKKALNMRPVLGVIVGLLPRF